VGFDEGNYLVLGREGRRFVADDFSMQSVGRRYEQFYRRLLAG